MNKDDVMHFPIKLIHIIKREKNATELNVKQKVVRKTFF